MIQKISISHNASGKIVKYGKPQKRKIIILRQSDVSLKRPFPKSPILNLSIPENPRNILNKIEAVGE
jgi:hypothetical protein